MSGVGNQHNFMRHVGAPYSFQRGAEEGRVVSNRLEDRVDVAAIKAWTQRNEDVQHHYHMRMGRMEELAEQYEREENTVSTEEGV